jgi:hypothetical protein
MTADWLRASRDISASVATIISGPIPDGSPIVIPILLLFTVSNPLV